MGRVLLIEDEPAMLEVFAALITDLGHECLTALDGDRGFMLARSERPDVVVTDYMMPGKSGIELIRALRAEPELGEVPVILVSAARPRDAVEAWRFLSKPIDLDALERCLAEAMAGRAPRSRPPAEPDGDGAAVNPAREEMLNWVAHEIKSPLSAAMMNAQMVRRTLLDGKPSPLRRRVEIILRQLQRMDQLVVSILDAARLDEGRLTLNRGPFDLCRLVADAVDGWRETYPEHQFTVHGDGQPLVLEADGERIRQIMDNLVSNAAKYGEPSRSIEITLGQSDGHACVSVRDHGAGMSPEQLDHIFDRFHRVGSGGRGHGLGLFIAAALARLHGGRLEAASEPGNGSTFTLSVPLAG